MKTLFTEEHAISSGGTSIQIFFGGKRNFRGGGQKSCKNARAKICHFYAKIVKFGLILTHFEIIWGGQENILGANAPHAPLWRRHWIYHIIIRLLGRRPQVSSSYSSWSWLKLVQQTVHIPQKTLDVILKQSMFVAVPVSLSHEFGHTMHKQKNYGDLLVHYANRLKPHSLSTLHRVSLVIGPKSHHIKHYLSTSWEVCRVNAARNRRHPSHSTYNNLCPHSSPNFRILSPDRTRARESRSVKDIIDSQSEDLPTELTGPHTL